MASSWKVTGDRVVSVKVGGNYVAGREISYVTGNDVAGEVTVTNADYRPDIVRQRIADAVAQHDLISGLSSESRGQPQ